MLVLPRLERGNVDGGVEMSWFLGEGREGESAGRGVGETRRPLQFERCAQLQRYRGWFLGRRYTVLDIAHGQSIAS